MRALGQQGPPAVTLGLQTNQGYRIYFIITESAALDNKMNRKCVKKIHSCVNNVQSNGTKIVKNNYFFFHLIGSNFLPLCRDKWMSPFPLSQSIFSLRDG
jgi:hypothetical protein